MACIIIRGTESDWYVFLVVMAVAAAWAGERYWRFFVQWLRGIRGRDWAAVSAVVDVVSIVPQTLQTRRGEEIIGYLATLTYFYRNPEMQMGEFSRMFDEEAKAEVWGASYKGKAVIVRVDPHDPARSVLRKEEL